MKTFLPAMRLMMIAVLPAAAQTSGAPSADDGSAHATYKTVHQGWTKPDEGNLLFITVDGPWDLNLVGGP